jgi:hypothetical protein
MQTMQRICYGLAVAMLLINTAVAADITPIFKVEGNNLYLSLDRVEAPTSVRILDPAGFAWIEEKVAGTGSFKKVFDLARLPQGAYRLVIESAKEEIVQPITVSGTELLLNESERTAYFRADLRQQRDQISLFLENPTRSVVRLYVLNPMGRMVHQEAIEGQPVIDQRVDLKHLPAGRYTVVVDNGHETFTQPVKLR